MLNKPKIEKELDDSGTANVLITLNLDALNMKSGSRFDKIDAAQGQIHRLLANLHSQTRRMYENFPVIHANINRQSLEALEASDLVAAVEAVMPVEMHTSQGIPLMDADVYRPVFGGSGVAVAIADSGVDYNHPALGNGGFPNSKVIGGYDFGNNDTDPMPVGVSHGTNCAGVAAGDIITYADYVGGVAPDSKIYALKIMPDGVGSSSTAEITEAIDWCVSNQFDDPNNPILVINLSVGGGRYFSTCDSSLSSLTNAVNTATAAGITVLSSSGNDGYCDSIGMPACISNVISVGAVYDGSVGTLGFCVSEDSCIGNTSSSCSTGYVKYDSTYADLVASYSNSSNMTDVLASSHKAYTPTLNGSYYSSFGGTSAACAYASGAVASLQSAARDTLGRFLTVAEVKELLTTYGQPVTDPKNSIVTPRISVANSIENLEIFEGERLTVTNDSRFSATIQSITSPAWITVHPAAPISLDGYESVTLYAAGECENCNYQPLTGSITIAGTGHPSNFSELVPATLNCPECEYIANLNAGCEVDLLDFTILADCWLSSDSACDTANIDGTLPVGESDLLILAEQWLEGK
jgi:subtilisin family serine protease